jgi:hypothetical protein
MHVKPGRVAAGIPKQHDEEVFHGTRLAVKVEVTPNCNNNEGDGVFEI